MTGDIVYKARDILRNQLTDPNSQRREVNGAWIHTDWPKLNAEHPRISVFEVDSAAEPIGVGTYEMRETKRFNVVIICSYSTQFKNPDDANELWNAERIVLYLIEQIKKILNGNQDLEDLGQYPHYFNTLRNDTQNHIQRVVEFEIWTNIGG